MMTTTVYLNYSFLMISREILDHEAHSTCKNLIPPKCPENSKSPKQHRRFPTIADKLATTK